MLTWKNSRKGIREHLQAFLEKIKPYMNKKPGMSCTWIGPPQATAIPDSRFKMFYDVAQEVLGGRCEIINSWTHTHYKGNDGLHYSESDSDRKNPREQEWISYVAGELSNKKQASSDGVPEDSRPMTTQNNVHSHSRGPNI